MTEVSPPYTAEQLQGDGISKKDLVTFLQENASLQFQQGHKLKGNLKSVSKTRSKDELVAAYNELFETKSFKKEGEDEAAAVAAAAAASAKKVEDVTQRTKKLSVSEEVTEEPKYIKRVLRKGNTVNYPRKGDTVSCWYEGKMPDGTVFDQNFTSGKKYKKAQPLRFKLGAAAVIKGWDHGVGTMSVGEKAEFIIQPEWAYGKKGLEGKIPPNTTLTFTVELVTID